MCRYIRFVIISLSQIYTVSTPHSCLLSSKETQTVGLHTDLMLNSNTHGQFFYLFPQSSICSMPVIYGCLPLKVYRV